MPTTARGILPFLKKNDAPSSLLKITIPSFSVTGVKTPRALLEKEIVGKKLLIEGPVIEINYTNAGKDSARTVPAKEIYEQLLGNLDLIKIDTVEIRDAQITTSNLKTGKKNIEFINTFIQLINVAVDRKTGSDSGEILFAQQLFLECEKLSWQSKNRLYDYSADSIAVNSVTNTVSAKRFRIDPLLNENAFVKSLPTQDDRFDFNFNNIRLRKVNIPKLFDEHIMADSILIASASFKIYRDLSIARDKKNRVGSYPHQLLEKIPVSFDVKKLLLSNTYVEYKEKNKITSQAGKVRFHNVSATFTNVTNNTETIEKNKVMTVDIHSRFLDKAPLTATWVFYLQHPKGRFDLKGKLGSIAAKDVTILTEPMGPAKMEDGLIRSLHFDLKGNNYTMDGTVKMLYNDLKIALLEKEEEGTKKLDKKDVASLVANIIIRKNNPGKIKDEVRVINIHQDRDTNRSIFHFVWKAIFKGIKETAGISK